MLGVGMRVLIVKISALGDVIQAFSVLDWLHKNIPGIQTDWAIDRSLQSIVAAHPLISRTIPLDLKQLKKLRGNWKQAWADLKQLRTTQYDVLFDLQGNIKSGVVTALARAHVKVGLGPRSVREWPNLLATQRRFEIDPETNIRLQYRGIVQRYFQVAQESSIDTDAEGVWFKLSAEEQNQIDAILCRPGMNRPHRIMVCPGSKWINKQLPFEALEGLLTALVQVHNSALFIVWGADEEREFAHRMHRCFPERSQVVERLSLPAWQNLMNRMDLVLAVDSSALHLCATTQTPSFSFFGPTSLEVFKPLGDQHLAFQGKCPYGRVFTKTCPALRTCPTGACLKSVTAEQLITACRIDSKK